MKQIRADIKNRLTTKCTAKFVSTWNGHDRMIDERNQFPFDFPAMFYEMNTEDVSTLGEGYNVYDPFDVKIHILHAQYDAGNGNMDENTDIEDSMNEVKLAFHQWEADGTSTFFFLGEERDYDHEAVFHAILTFRTCYVSKVTANPRNGITINPPITIEVNSQYNH